MNQSSTKKTRQDRTIAEWVDLFALYESHGGKKTFESGKKFLESDAAASRGFSCRELRSFYSKHKLWKDGKLSHGGVRRRTGAKFAAVQQRAIRFIREYLKTAGTNPTLSKIKEVSMQAAADLGMKEFRGSKGWIMATLRKVQDTSVEVNGRASQVFGGESMECSQTQSNGAAKKKSRPPNAGRHDDLTSQPMEDPDANKQGRGTSAKAATMMSTAAEHFQASSVSSAELEQLQIDDPVQRLPGNIPMEVNTIVATRAKPHSKQDSDSFAQSSERGELKLPCEEDSEGQPLDKAIVPKLPTPPRKEVKNTNLVSPMGCLRSQDESDKTRKLFCLAYGLVGCGFDQEPFDSADGRTEWRPRKKDLLQEARRRHSFQGMKKRLVPKPNTEWSTQQLKQWLDRYPVAEPDDVRFLRQEIENLARSLTQPNATAGNLQRTTPPDKARMVVESTTNDAQVIVSGPDAGVGSRRMLLPSVQELKNSPARYVRTCVNTLRTCGKHDVRLACLETLIRVAENCDNCDFQVAIRVVSLTILPKSSGQPAILARGCELFAILANATAEYRVAIGEHGMVGFVLDGMRRFPTNTFFLVRACHSLVALAHLSLNNCERIYDEDGVAVTIGLMKNKKLHDSEEIAMWCCRVLKELAFDFKVAPTIQKFGGIKEIVLAMKRHPRNIELQRWGCFALAELVVYDDKSCAELKNMGGVEVVVKAIKTQIKDPEVQGFGFRLIAAVVSEKGGADPLFKSDDIIVVIVSSMKLHEGNSSLQEWGYRALDQLATSDAICLKIADLFGRNGFVARVTQHENGDLNRFAKSLKYKLDTVQSMASMQRRIPANKLPIRSNVSLLQKK